MNWLLAVGGGAGALAAIGVVLRGAWRINRHVVQLATVVTELSPNGGRSVKDTVDCTKETAARTEAKVDQLAARFDQHLRDHERRPRWWLSGRR